MFSDILRYKKKLELAEENGVKLKLFKLSDVNFFQLCFTFVVGRMTEVRAPYKYIEVTGWPNTSLLPYNPAVIRSRPSPSKASVVIKYFPPFFKTKFIYYFIFILK